MNEINPDLGIIVDNSASMTEPGAAEKVRDLVERLGKLDVDPDASGVRVVTFTEGNQTAPHLSSTHLRLACMALCFERAAIALRTDRPEQAAAFEVCRGALNLAAHAVDEEYYVQAGVYLGVVESRLWDFESHYLRDCAVPRIHKAVAVLKGIYRKSDGSWVNGMRLYDATEVLKEVQEYVLLGVTLVVAEVERLQRLARKAP